MVQCDLQLLVMMIVTVGVRVIAGPDWGCLLCQALGWALYIESIQASCLLTSLRPIFLRRK